MGRYIDEKLVRGETILYEAEMHWSIVIWLVLLIPILIGIPLLIAGLIAMLTTEMAVTSRRVIGKRGLIMRRAIDLSHNRVESIQIQQGIFGRILNSDTVVVRGTGGTFINFPGIANPLEFRRQAIELFDQAP